MCVYYGLVVTGALCLQMPDHHLLIPWSLGAAVSSPPLGFVGLEKPEAQEQQNRGDSGSGFEDMHLCLLLPLPAGSQGPRTWARWLCGGERTSHRPQVESQPACVHH